MAIQSRSLTFADLQRVRETRDERLELIDGELYVTPSPTLLHQDILGALYILFRRVVFDSGRGRVYFAPLDTRLAETTIVQPNLVIILSDRPVLTVERIEGTPSLAVEIVSPSTGAYDRVTKRNLYARHGVPEYWLVDPDAETVTIYSDPQDDRYHTEQTTSDIAVSVTISGLSADLGALFAPVPDA